MFSICHERGFEGTHRGHSRWEKAVLCVCHEGRSSYSSNSCLVLLPFMLPFSLLFRLPSSLPFKLAVSFSLPVNQPIRLPSSLLSSRVCMGRATGLRRSTGAGHAGSFYLHCLMTIVPDITRCRTMRSARDIHSMVVWVEASMARSFL